MTARSLAFAACVLLAALLASPLAASDSLSLQGQFTQGGLIFGSAPPGSSVKLDGKPVRLTADGRFVIGFTREAPKSARIVATFPDGRSETRDLVIAQRRYQIDRLNGLPQNQVTPSAEELARINRENAKIVAARSMDSDGLWFLESFIWPAEGRISGVYGSQRILNGEPRQPHYGVDVAAPVGTPVIAPAGGVVTLAERDLFFTGGTIMIDHGYGLSSAFLHMSAIEVEVGQVVSRGDRIGAIGATGRVTGAHLDWRMNWFEARIDPQLLAPARP